MFAGKLKCFVCRRHVSDDVDGLRNHFKDIHGLLNVVGGNVNLICFQDGCTFEFPVFHLLAKHIENFHLRFEADMCSNVISSSITEINEVFANDNEETHIQLDNFAMDTVFKLQANPRSTNAYLDKVIDACSDTFNNAKKQIQEEITQFFNSKNLDPSLKDELLSNINKQSPFIKYQTDFNRWCEFKKHYNYIKPHSIKLGSRVDRSNNGIRAKLNHVNETYQYVSIIATLKSIMDNKSTRLLFDSEKSSDDGFIRTFKDGVRYKHSEYFTQYPNSLRIIFYYDDIEVVNPLGAKTGIHKVGAFYFTLENFPKEINSKLSNIFLLALCYAEDIKKYSMNAVLKEFIAEMKILESDEGYLTKDLNGDIYCLRAALCLVSADTLAAHELFGFMGPKADYFCRQCLISRSELNEHVSGFFELRTPDQHTALLESIQNKTASRNFGLKNYCSLSDLRFFSVTLNFNFDLMHDLLEGIIPYTLKLVLHYYITKKSVMTVAVLNTRIKEFNYGNVEAKNKPSDNFTTYMLSKSDTKLKQKASQYWLLLRVMPYILYDKVEKDIDSPFELLLLLNKITSIVTLSEFESGTLTYLDRIIQEYLLAFQCVFPENRKINKHHHLTHYVEAIRYNGPLISFWCMRFEAKHNDLKILARVSNNFRNIALTLAKRHQFTQAYQLKQKNKDDYFSKSIQIKSISASNGKRTVEVNGTTYKLGLLLCTNFKNDEPQFGEIKEINEIEDDVLFGVIGLTSLGYCNDLNSYELKKPKINCKIIYYKYSTLVHYRPLNLWQTFNSNEFYVCPKMFL